MNTTALTVILKNIYKSTLIVRYPFNEMIIGYRYIRAIHDTPHVTFKMLYHDFVRIESNVLASNISLVSSLADISEDLDYLIPGEEIPNSLYECVSLSILESMSRNNKNFSRFSYIN